jgi:hypothetical protein
MALERQISHEGYADNPVKDKLNEVHSEFNTEMRKLFGVTLMTSSVRPNIEATPEDIVGFIEKGRDTMVQQIQILEEAGLITEATAVDLVGTDDELTLTDFQRALEFLAGTRRNGDSMQKIWTKLTNEATENLEQISPMPYAKPSLFLPRRINQALFGNDDRSIWKAKRKEMNKGTLAQINRVNDIVNQTWFTVNQNG